MRLPQRQASTRAQCATQHKGNLGHIAHTLARPQSSHDSWRSVPLAVRRPKHQPSAGLARQQQVTRRSIHLFWRAHDQQSTVDVATQAESVADLGLDLLHVHPSHRADRLQCVEPTLGQVLQAGTNIAVCVQNGIQYSNLPPASNPGPLPSAKARSGENAPSGEASKMLAHRARSPNSCPGQPAPLAHRQRRIEAPVHSLEDQKRRHGPYLPLMRKVHRSLSRIRSACATSASRSSVARI